MVLDRRGLTGVAVVALMALLSVGCSGKTDKDGGSGPEGGGSGSVSFNDLKNLALTLLHYNVNTKKGPSKPEDLAPYLESDDGKELLGKVQSGDIVVIWGVSIPDLEKGPGGPAGQVVAYDKDAPTKGGY